MSLLINPTNDYIIHNCLWVVDLSDGRRIYQNDNEDNTSWLYLKEYLYHNREYFITGMFLRFRDHFEGIGYDSDCYFFSKKVLANFGTNYNYDYYVAGCLTGKETILVKHYKIPDLVVDETETRYIGDGKYNRNIIIHPDYLVNFDKDKYFGT